LPVRVPWLAKSDRIDDEATSSGFDSVCEAKSRRSRPQRRRHHASSHGVLIARPVNRVLGTSGRAAVKGKKSGPGPFKPRNKAGTYGSPPAGTPAAASGCDLATSGQSLLALGGRTDSGYRRIKRPPGGAGHGDPSPL